MGRWDRFHSQSRGQRYAHMSFIKTLRTYGPWRQLGDYGYFSDSGCFGRQGNAFDDLQPILSGVDIAPGYHKVTTKFMNSTKVVDSCGLSLPNNRAFNSRLASLSPRAINAYIVTRIVQCRPSEYCAQLGVRPFMARLVSKGYTVIFCTIEKPFVWHRDEVPFV